MSAADREARTRAADDLCRRAWAEAGGPDAGAALVAVGGFGRAELAAGSDLDVLLVHADDHDPGDLAERLWYPLWDSGHDVDHAVRSVAQSLEAARADLRVALGLLDLRCLAGDPAVADALRSRLLAWWRRDAREHLPALRELSRSRHERVGELAHMSVPDLKEAAGGLRDATVLKALVATWLVEIPRAELDDARTALLDVRDDARDLGPRAGDRLGPEAWTPLAERWRLGDAVAAQVRVRTLGRRIEHLSRIAWRRVDGVLDRARRPGQARVPQLRRVAPGVAVASAEIVLERGADPARDPLLLLRAAAEAAERDLLLAPATAARLARESAPLPEPWPAPARQLMVRLLAAGEGLREVWETLDETGVVDRLLPEWGRIRSLPHASVVHRFTVDRHVVETCVEAAGLIRDVARPDVLIVAALLHDIGKGGLTEHSVAGEPIAREVARRWGFGPEEVALIGDLVRRHLLLSEIATTRDPDDPATVAALTDVVATPERLSLLTALTEADARATSPKAWSRWRAGLVHQLSRRATSALLADGAGTVLVPAAEAALPVPSAVAGDARAFDLDVEVGDDGSRITVLAQDRRGLLADVAAALALLRLPVRAARAWMQDQYAVSVWESPETHLDPKVLRTRLAGIVEGRIDPAPRLRPAATPRLEPSVVVRPEASLTATVIEVRTDDQPGVVALVCRALAGSGIVVRSAHISTLGPQAVDVFYVQEESAGVLTEQRSAQAAHTLRDALSGG